MVSRAFKRYVEHLLNRSQPGGVGVCGLAPDCDVCLRGELQHLESVQSLSLAGESAPWTGTMAGRSCSGTRSQANTSTQLSWTIPALFQSTPRPHLRPTIAVRGAALPNTGTAGPDIHCSQPPQFRSLADLQLVAKDIKNTLSAAISDHKTDLRAVASRLEHVETEAQTHAEAIQHVQRATGVHAQHLIYMNCHLEDLDNRGRRSNLRIRGIPGSIESIQLQPVVWAIFNTLLGRPPDTPVEMERCHGGLWPRGRDTDPPRDTVA